jgi:hypothetical protein
MTLLLWHGRENHFERQYPEADSILRPGGTCSSHGAATRIRPARTSEAQAGYRKCATQSSHKYQDVLNSQACCGKRMPHNIHNSFIFKYLYLSRALIRLKKNELFSAFPEALLMNLMSN